MRGEPLIAFTIVTKALSEIMGLAVNLDNELARMSDKIGNVVAHRALSAKSEFRKPMSLEVAP